MKKNILIPCMVDTNQAQTTNHADLSGARMKNLKFGACTPKGDSINCYIFGHLCKNEYLSYPSPHMN